MSKTKVSYFYRSVTDGCGCCSWPASYFDFVHPDGRTSSTGDQFGDHDVGFAADVEDFEALMVRHYGADWADDYVMDVANSNFY